MKTKTHTLKLNYLTEKQKQRYSSAGGAGLVVFLGFASRPQR